LVTFFGAAFTGAAFTGAVFIGAAFIGAAFIGAAFIGAAFTGVFFKLPLLEAAFSSIFRELAFIVFFSVFFAMGVLLALESVVTKSETTKSLFQKTGKNLGSPRWGGGLSSRVRIPNYFMFVRSASKSHTAFLRDRIAALTVRQFRTPWNMGRSEQPAQYKRAARVDLRCSLSNDESLRDEPARGGSNPRRGAWIGRSAHDRPSKSA
jgi:hypothetical protein